MDAGARVRPAHPFESTEHVVRPGNEVHTSPPASSAGPRPARWGPEHADPERARAPLLVFGNQEVRRARGEGRHHAATSLRVVVDRSYDSLGWAVDRPMPPCVRPQVDELD